MNTTTRQSQLGASIRALREVSGLSREDVARSLNRRAASLYRWETGKGEPPLGTLRELARVLGAELVVTLRRKPRNGD